jgi:hypothetical protein
MRPANRVDPQILDHVDYTNVTITSSVCRCVPVFSDTRLSVVRAVPDAAVLYELGAPLGSISPCAAPIAQAGKRCGGLLE